MLRGDVRTKIVSAVVFLAVALFGGQQLLDTSAPPEVETTENVENIQNADPSAEESRFSDLPPISLNELPIEALETLDRIESDGPHLYQKDGSTFENREGLLPDQTIGHYQEFTVVTPGSDDRGARRIVTGETGEQFYTGDHYASFSEIVG